MFRLRTLGQIDLRDSEGREVDAVLVQPKRLALLVYLAKTTAAGFHRRDLILPVFWPELPEDGARNALRQALHQLRRVLGKDVILSRGTDAVSVNPELLSCDATAFGEAIARGAFDEAIALYHGDFLPGFSIDGADEFDHWLDQTRRELRQDAVRAAKAGAERSERMGDLTAAVRSARAALDLSDDESLLRYLLTLLDRSGDHAGALGTYADFERRINRDSGAKPSRETATLVQAIRTRADTAGKVDETDSSAAPTAATPAGRQSVTLTPFENQTGDAAFDFIGRLMLDAIAQGLLESRVVDVVTPENPADLADARHQTGFVVKGSYLIADDTWHFQVKVLEASRSRVLENIGDVSAPRDRPWDAAGDLRRRVSGMLASRLDRRFASWANAVAQAPDLDAHRELALGAELHLAGDFRGAIPHFLRAGAASEGFALPTLWAIQASCNLEEFEQAEAFLSELTAPPKRNRLSAFEKLGCDYLAACLDGQRGNALRIARTASEIVPGSEVLSWLGREALFCNQPRAAVETLEKLDPGLGWIPSWTPYWRRLTEAYHVLGEHAKELDAARRGRSRHPEAVSALMYEARAFAALGDASAVDRCVDEACALPRDRFADAGELMIDAARELRAHGDAASAVRIAERAIVWCEEEQLEDEPRTRTQLKKARACYEAARWEEARGIVDSLLHGSPDDVALIGFRGAVAGRMSREADAREAITTLRSKTGRFRFGAHLVWSARILAILGDAEGAVTALRGAFARGYCYGIELHADTDLSLLREHPAFRELLRPKG